MVDDISSDEVDPNAIALTTDVAALRRQAVSDAILAAINTLEAAYPGDAEGDDYSITKFQIQHRLGNALYFASKLP